MLQAKISHAVDTKVYMPSGLKLARRFLPPSQSMKFFIEKMIRRAVLDAMPAGAHRCTAACGRVANLMLKCNNKASLKENLPEDLADFVLDFEEHLNSYHHCYLEHAIGQQQVKALAIMFVPCNKKLEVLDSAIYL